MFVYGETKLIDFDDTVDFPHKEKACEESHCAWKKEQRDEYNKGCLPFTKTSRVQILCMNDFFDGFLVRFHGQFYVQLLV